MFPHFALIFHLNCNVIFHVHLCKFTEGKWERKRIENKVAHPRPIEKHISRAGRKPPERRLGWKVFCPQLLFGVYLFLLCLCTFTFLPGSDTQSPPRHSCISFFRNAVRPRVQFMCRFLGSDLDFQVLRIPRRTGFIFLLPGAALPRSHSCLRTRSATLYFSVP